MEKKDKIALRKVYMVNRFDRACNFLLMRIFPHGVSDERANNCYAALEYAHTDLMNEKLALKQLKNLARQKGSDMGTKLSIIFTINEIEHNQYKRHSKMSEIIEGKKVR